MTSRERYVALAEVARPHGVRGELRLKVYNLESDLLERQRRVRLVTRAGEAKMVRLRSARPVPGALLVRFEGVDDRDAADALRGATVEVARELLDELEDTDEHYVTDLVGAEVLLGEATVGVVTDVASYPTCDALVVKRVDGTKLEIPLQGAYVGDIEAGVIHLLTLDGLT